ncbi:hypothetical protein B0H14DRAFT_3497460 [Mycena olivaceomarginata]|nr:hypothetical protein B0H14DRAFT_3497460 [Mycena olivaceomarginata]
MHRGFPDLLALWGDTPLPLPPPHPYFCTPTWPPWAGPVVDAANERAALFTDAQAEERHAKLGFVLKYHVLHPNRDSQPPEFLRQHSLLLARLACAHTIFFLRTHLQKHVTAATAARARAIVGARQEEVTAGARAAAVYTFSLTQDDFLSAWLTRPYTDVYLWGTVHDPRTPPLPPAPLVTWGEGGGGWGSPWAGDWSRVWEDSNDDSVGPWSSLDWSTCSEEVQFRL